MFGFFRSKTLEEFDDTQDVEALAQEMGNADAILALLKAEFAAQKIRLAGKTNDLAPLLEAEEAIAIARKYYIFEKTPVEIGMVQAALGDMLFKLGREKANKPAFTRARDAYRGAITLASLHGDDSLRDDLRKKVKIVESYMGVRKQTPSLFRVA